MAKTFIFGALVSAHLANAQSRPPVREIGKLERVSTDSLRSVIETVHMRDGHVLANDPISRRVLLFDSTLAHPVVVADTTSATANAYGTHRGGTIMRYRGDSALYIDQAALTMFVISPTGQLGRVMAFPQPPIREAGGQLITGAASGPPGFDARGRLIYVSTAGAPPGSMSMRVDASDRDPKAPSGVSPNQYADSTFAFRVDLAARKTDTIAALRKGKGIMRIRVVEGVASAIENSLDPLPLIDQWTVLPDGTFAIVRGRDYHIDWLGADGVWNATPKMEFEWQRLTDEQKTQKRDSADNALRERLANRGGGAASAPPPGGGGRGGGGGGRGGGGGDAPPTSGSQPVPNIAIEMPLDEIADYIPPFTDGSVRSDADGNVWIRTTTIKGDRPVYDVVDRKGTIVDRVQLPANRVITGFGPGIIYMSVKEPTGNVRIERARIR